MIKINENNICDFDLMSMSHMFLDPNMISFCFALLFDFFQQFWLYLLLNDNMDEIGQN